MRFRRTSGTISALAATAGFAALVSSCSQIGQVTTKHEPIVEVHTEPSRVAITLDDLPYVLPSRTTPAEGTRYVQQINKVLQKHNIIATGFAVGRQITPESRPALQAFADAGHTIGNHSWSHADYGTQTRKEFEDETRQTDQILTEWLDGPRYYRFPFLREGESEKAKACATDVLTTLGYQNVPVTIDYDEWQFNADYLDAIENGDSEASEDIARRYIAHMQERTGHFQALARDELARDVDHILLLHLNRINADHLGTLLDWYASQAWTLVSVQQALKDPLYSSPDLYAGARGLSQIERVLGRKSD